MSKKCKQRLLIKNDKNDAKLGRAFRRICDFIHNCSHSLRFEEQDDPKFVEHDFDRLRELIYELRVDWAGIQIYLADCRNDDDLPKRIFQDYEILWHALPALTEEEAEIIDSYRQEERLRVSGSRQNGLQAPDPGASSPLHWQRQSKVLAKKEAFVEIYCSDGSFDHCLGEDVPADAWWRPTSRPEEV